MKFQGGFYVTHCLDLEMSSERSANMFKSKATNNLAWKKYI